MKCKTLFTFSPCTSRENASTTSSFVCLADHLCKHQSIDDDISCQLDTDCPVTSSWLVLPRMYKLKLVSFKSSMHQWFLHHSNHSWPVFIEKWLCWFIKRLQKSMHRHYPIILLSNHFWSFCTTGCTNDSIHI